LASVFSPGARFLFVFTILSLNHVLFLVSIASQGLASIVDSFSPCPFPSFVTGDSTQHLVLPMKAIYYLNYASSPYFAFAFLVYFTGKAFC
jgi:hypothetical protein